MMENPNAKYLIETEQYDVSYDDYVNFEKSYGYFSKEGTSYTVTDRNTPRQWLNFMVNDRFAAVAANDGSGFNALAGFYLRITKFYCHTDYLVRALNGKRKILLTETENGKKYDLLSDCKNMKYTVTPGAVVYEGSIGDIYFNIEIFVPNEDSCECWIIKLKNSSGQKTYRLTVGEDIAILNMPLKDKTVLTNMNAEVKINDGAIYVKSENNIRFKEICAVFSSENMQGEIEKYTEDSGDGRKFTYIKANLSKDIGIDAHETVIHVCSGAAFSEQECAAISKKYAKISNVSEEKKKLCKKWDKIISENYCEIPDKNLQYFLNIWLKNQIYLTMRYNRFDIMGYRDIIQDIWGHLFVSADDVKSILIEALSKMKSDGRCPKKFDKFSDMTDEHDFMDGPVWIPITLSGYIKETGDFSILDEKIGYIDSDRIDTVSEHIKLSLDYLYHSRGKNNLILMRRGDWLDGLEGINELGEATTVWGTMAAFHAQNIMAELYKKIGDEETAKILLERSCEYKKVVNDVAWDGNWYAYAFIDDEPIGSAKLNEGKIYLNPQSWALITGIYDDEKKVDKIYRAVNTYLMSMYGPHVMAPPYTKYGDKCGRLQKQRPGTFANSAIYLHAASFKVMADCAVKKYDDALDLLQRILPNHPDNCDARRTSEPYSVGNVYYGITHPCYGQNLYTWFTATPAWLIHGGFEELLGVKAEYDGLKIEARDIDGWDEYAVTKVFRGTRYNIRFKRGENKGIYLDNQKIETNVILSDRTECNVEVIY